MKRNIRLVVILLFMLSAVIATLIVIVIVVSNLLRQWRNKKNKKKICKLKILIVIRKIIISVGSLETLFTQYALCKNAMGK